MGITTVPGRCIYIGEDFCTWDVSDKRSSLFPEASSGYDADAGIFNVDSSITETYGARGEEWEEGVRDG